MNNLKQPQAAAAAVALTLAFAAPSAEAQQITAFTTANVIQALSAIGVQGAEAKRLTGPNGEVADVVGFSVGGVRHVGVLEVCNTGAPGCLGLNLLTVWPDAGSVVDRNKINDFNAAIPFAKGMVAGTAVVFQRYTISDGGVSQKNVQENIVNFVGLSDKFQQYVGGSGGAGTISAKPGEGALTRASLSPEAAMAIVSTGDENSNLWNASTGPVSIEDGAHALSK